MTWPVVDEFATLMRAELDSNTDKGGWEGCSPEWLMGEIWWHTAKLAMAVRSADQRAIAEHTADVANMAMMLADNFGCLSPFAALDGGSDG